VARNINRVIVFVIAFLFAISNIAFAIQNSGEVVVTTDEDIIIPFELQGHRMVVKVRFNDNPKEYDLIFDTGGLMMISEDVAAELGLKKGMEVPTWDKEIKAYLTKTDSIMLGRAKVADMKITIFNFLQHAGIEDADGLLGSDFLSFYKVAVDYKKQQITLSHSTDPIQPDSNSFKLKFMKHIMIGAPMVKCTINGNIEEYGMIDVGMPYGFVMPLSLMEEFDSSRLELIESVGEMAKWPMSKNETSYLARLESLKIGDLELANIPVIFTDIFSTLIGRDILEQFMFTINYPQKEVMITPFEDMHFKNNLFSPGINIKKEAAKSIVKGFWKGSPADASGIQIGDEVLKLNSRPISDYTQGETDSLFNDDSVTEFEFLIKSGDETKEIMLRKEYLLPIISE
jgi:predicted aspartyl protease